MALTGSNTITTLNGFFKTVYGDSLKDLIPNWAVVQSDIGFSTGDRTGKDWRIPVAVQMEQGVTYMASGGLTDLVAASPGATLELTVLGFQHVLRSRLDYESAFSAATNTAAFKRTTAHIVESMWTSIRRRLEIDLIYGQRPLGIVESVAGSIITITEASWAPGIWAGMTGASVLAATIAADVPTATTMAANVILKVDLANRAITMTTISSPVATNGLFFAGALTPAATPVYFSMMGLDRIIAGTFTGATFFGIDPANYELLKGFSVSAGSTDLSFGTIQDALAEAASRGADSDFIVYVSPKTWSNLMNDQSALRRYDASYETGRAVMGAKSIEFWGPFGKVSIKSHPLIKQGEAFGITPANWKRIGATDVTFSRPDLAGKADGNSFFLELEANAAFELRCYSHQALFTYAPAKAFKITNIVNS